MAGLGFYVYQPARVTYPIWIVFCSGWDSSTSIGSRCGTLLHLGAIATVGVVLTAGPIFYRGVTDPAGQWNRPTGRPAHLQGSPGAAAGLGLTRASEWEGYKTNVRQGLGTFNSTVVDHAWIYANHGHGFVDPLTGILLWLGVGVVGVGLVRRREDEGALLMLGGFLALWLSFAFLVNKAPNYTRLLVTLPFVAYLVTEAVRWLADRWRSVPLAAGILVGAAAAVLMAWNLAIAWDFIDDGRRAGQDIGSTTRYVHEHEASGHPGQEG